MFVPRYFDDNLVAFIINFLFNSNIEESFGLPNISKAYFDNPYLFAQSSYSLNNI